MARFQIRADRDGCLPQWVDRDVRMPGSLKKPSRKLLDGSGNYEKACRFEPDGILSFPKKKKNGCKLLSQSQIRIAVDGTTRKHKVMGCAGVFSKIKLDASDLTV